MQIQDTEVPPPLTDTSPAGMRAAIEADVVATRLTNVDVPVEPHLDPDIAWAVAPDPNAWRSVVVRATMTEGEADRRIQQVLERMDAIGSTMLWWHAPHHRPVDLPQRLVAHGFEKVAETAAMALDLATLVATEDTPPNLVTRPVTTERDARDYVAVIEADRPENAPTALGSTEGEARIRHIVERIELDPAPMRFVGRVEGVPVATSRLSIVGGVAGLYAVVTIPEARGRGYGRALTRAALEAGRTLGMRIATLQATDLGLPVYSRLGFRTFYAYDLYRRPPAR